MQGVALDPQAQQGSGIDQVSFFLGDRNTGGIPLGSAEPSSGPRLDDFTATVTLPNTTIGEHEFVAYAHSAVTGKETQVSLPIVLGEDPAKAGVVKPAAESAPSMTGAAGQSACDTSSSAPSTTSAAPAPLAVTVPVPGASGSEPGIATAEAYAAAVEQQAQAPDDQSGSGEEQLQQ